MEAIFENILHTSLSGSVVILVILAIRGVLKNTSKGFICLLWMLAILRLLVPFSIESSVSLQPDSDRLALPRPVYSTMPERPAGDPITPNPQPGTSNPGDTVLSPSPGMDLAGQPDSLNIPAAAIAAAVWAVVCCGFLVYAAASYILLKRRVRNAVQLDEGIFECDAIDSPFLLGYIQPNIYLPAGLPLQDLDHILAHEKTHIHRLDNWTKLLMFLCLALHWFNPLVWIAYLLLCRDMEMACDEQVVRHMSVGDRKAYSGALLNCAARHRLVSACPVAFGEVSVKQRILKVLNYRKPGFWMNLIAVAAIVFVAVCFLTNPAPSQEELLLNQCAEALESWQNMSSRHLHLYKEFHGEDILNDSANVDYWRSEDRYLRCVRIPLSGTSHCRTELSLDGTLLLQEYFITDEGHIDWISDWQESANPVSALYSGSILYSWVDTFRWDAHSIQYMDSQTDGDMTVITLSVTEDPVNGGENHLYTEGPYTVSFCFTSDGILDSIVQTVYYESETGNSDQEQESEGNIFTFRLIPENAEQIAAEVDSHYTNAAESLQGK